MEGGYLVIDLKNKNHALNTPVVHKGISEQLESARKTVLFTNVVINNIEERDLIVNLTVSNTGYVALFNLGEKSYTITITNTDEVTFILNT